MYLHRKIFNKSLRFIHQNVQNKEFIVPAALFVLLQDLISIMYYLQDIVIFKFLAKHINVMF